MSALEQVMQMKGQGYSDDQIAYSLQQQGVSPREIGDALNQAQIKNAIGGIEMQQYAEPQQMPSEEYYQSQNPEAPQLEAPSPAENNPQQNYQPQAYAPEDYSYAPSTDTNSIIEIAEQVFSEKSQKMQRIVEDLQEFKAISNANINSFNERLQRIERTIDKLQISILDKIGSYGDNLDSIKKEMSMIENSFSKVLEHKTHSHETTSEHKSKK